MHPHVDSKMAGLVEATTANTTRIALKYKTNSCKLLRENDQEKINLKLLVYFSPVLILYAFFYVYVERTCFLEPCHILHKHKMSGEFQEDGLLLSCVCIILYNKTFLPKYVKV